jgi:hypothetical protein
MDAMEKCDQVVAVCPVDLGQQSLLFRRIYAKTNRIVTDSMYETLYGSKSEVETREAGPDDLIELARHLSRRRT